MNPLFHSTITVGSSIMALIAIAHIWQRREVPGRRSFIALMLALGGWSLLSGLHALADDVGARVLIAKVQYLSIAATPLAWLLTARSVAGLRRLPPRAVAALTVVPVITVLLAWSNEAHRLIWSAITPRGDALIYSYGPWFWAHVTYSYALMLAALLTVARAIPQAAPAFRAQLVIAFIAGLLPWLGNLLYVTRALPIPGFDPTPLSFTLTGLLVLWGMTRHQLFSLVPIARSVLIDHMGDGVLVLDRHTRVLDFNPAALRLSGLSPDVFGRPLGAALPALGPALDQERGGPLLIEQFGPQGARVEVEATPLSDRIGPPSGWLIVLRDVTLRQSLAAQLRAERDFALQVMRTMGEGLTITDAQGRFTFVNDAYGRMLGYAPGELIGHTPYELTAPGDTETLRQQHANRTRGQSGSYLTELRAADGRTVRVQVTGTPRFIDGEFVGSIAVVTDLTERLALERRLQETQHLESIGTLAGGVAHDFNNLLMAILGHAELTLMDLPPDSPAASSVQAIVDGAQRAADLTGRLLAYAGKGRFQLGPVDLNALLTNLGPLIRAALGANSQLIHQLQEDLPLIEADAHQLRQAVLNLIVNADEALGPGGGQITLATGLATLDAARLAGMLLGEGLPPGPYVQLTVSDTGPGMDAATQERIFEPFFSTHFAGRGLGLASVYGIVRSHHGAIQVASAPGMGTTMRIWLPARGQPPADSR